MFWLFFTIMRDAVCKYRWMFFMHSLSQSMSSDSFRWQKVFNKYEICYAGAYFRHVLLDMLNCASYNALNTTFINMAYKS